MILFSFFFFCACARMLARVTCVGMHGVLAYLFVFSFVPSVRLFSRWRLARALQASRSTNWLALADTQANAPTPPCSVRGVCGRVPFALLPVVLSFLFCFWFGFVCLCILARVVVVGSLLAGATWAQWQQQRRRHKRMRPIPHAAPLAARHHQEQSTKPTVRTLHAKKGVLVAA